MSVFDTVLIIGGLALVVYLAWPLVNKDLDMRTEEWVRTPGNVEKLGAIVNSKYARAYSGCNCGR